MSIYVVAINIFEFKMNKEINIYENLMKHENV